MAPLKFISLSVGSLLLLQGTPALGGTQNKSSDITEDCLTEFNAIRVPMGYPKYTKLDTAEYQEAKEQAVTRICTDLATADDSGKTSVTEKGANVAYALQDDGNCAKAVQSFRNSFERLGTALPPKYTKGGDTSYYQQSVINFIALYNPNEAELHCSFVSCNEATTETLRRRLSENTKAVVCIVKPGAIKDGFAPYSQEQYDKILAAFAPSSATAAVPTFLALAAVAAGFAFM